MPNWTEAQNRVITTRGASQMVSAAAGSGKTAVMTEYIVRLLEEGTDVSSLAVVTFTHAAAGEMTQRIRSRLEAGLETDPRLRGQLGRLEDAWISTFHGLCGRIITRYGAVAQLPPGLAPAGEEEQALLWLDAFEEALEEALARSEEGLELLMKGWRGRDGRGLQELVRQVYDYCMARPQGLPLVRAMADAYEAQASDPAHSLWQEALEAEKARLLEACRSLLEKALDLCRQGGLSYERSLLDDLEHLARREKLSRLSNRKKTDDPVLAARVKALRDRAKEYLEGKYPPLEDPGAGDMAAMIPAVRALAALTEDAATRYARAKEERGVMDFADMEHFALRILEEPAVAEELREGFAVVLVDEYQDTNRVQEAILARISREDNLFTVGDGKQAIYGFRQAEPGLFLERCALPDTERRQLTRLVHNFRSAPAVVDFVNQIFTLLMTRERGGVDYTEAERLVCRAPRPEAEDGEPGVELVLTGEAAEEEEDGDDALAEMTAIEEQAAAAAAVILRRLGQPLFDGKQNTFRTATWRDFAILLRARQGKIAAVAQVLEQRGVPACALGGGGWMEQLEVQQTLQLLRLVDNRHRDLELITTMRSFFGGFPLRALWEIRKAHPEGSYTAAAEAMAQAEGELPRQLRAFLARLEGWREDARILDTESLIWKLLEESGYYDWLGTLPGGEVRQGNLRLLLEKARALAGGRNRGVYGLLQYLDRLAQNNKDGDLAVTVPENADVVRVTTIHGSKGLEYPVVILMDLDKKMNTLGQNRDHVQLDDRMGFGLQALDLAARRWTDTLSRQAMALAQHRRELSEEVRILYVALTRARETLVLVAPAKGLQKRCARWALPPEAAMEAGEGCYLDWLGPVLLRSPGAEALREIAPCEVRADYTPLRVTRLSGTAQRPRTAPPLMTDADPRRLRDFDWQYPYRADLPAKIAATDRVQPAPAVMTRPGRGLRFTAAQRGTFTHLVLEKMTDDPRATAEHLAERGLLPREALAEIHYEWLDAWLRHPLFARMRTSPRVERELPFNLLLPPREALGVEGADPVMVQGVIDLAFLEGGAWVLVDYKTGDVLPGLEAAYRDHYAPQLALYRRALEALTPYPVKSAGIYILPRALYMTLEDKNERS